VSSIVKIIAAVALLAIAGAPASSRPPLSCPAGPFIAYFAHDSTKLTAKGRATLDNAISQFGTCSEPQAVVVGHTDTSEPTDLSRRRAIVVRAYLIAHGIPDRATVLRWKGSGRLQVPTPRKTAEALNRRVELDYVYDLSAFDAWLSQ